MNNDRTHSAEQRSVPTPGWGSADSDHLGYDGAGRAITKRVLAGGINQTTHAYEDTDPVVGFTTAFDRASNKLYERELHAESRSHLYEPFAGDPPEPQGGYDSLDRLRQYQRGTLASGGGSIDTVISLPDTDEQRDYVLDGLGNWKETDFTPVGGSLTEETRNHNKLNQIIKRQPDDGDPWIDFTHDDNGNLTDDGVRTYEWDALNRLYRVKRKSDDKTLAEYAYNAPNHRIRKAVSNGGLSGNVPDGQTNFIYNDDWQCVEERDSSDVLLRQHVWGVYIDELLQMREVDGESSDDRYPLQDLLYRTTALTDDSGAIVEAYDTDAYGNTLIFDSPGTGSDWWADDPSQADVPACAFIFTGRRFDPETELHQYRHRYYSPVWGRFVSRDPLGKLRSQFAPRDFSLRYIDGVNVYQYTESNPSNYRDPSGLCRITWQCELVADNYDEGENERHCVYRCRDVARNQGVGDHFQCADIGVPLGAMTRTRFRRNPSRWFGFVCPRECDDDFSFTQFYNPEGDDFFPRIDYQDCIDACNKGNAADRICRRLPPKKRVPCQLAVGAGKGACKAYCEVFQDGS